MWSVLNVNVVDSPYAVGGLSYSINVLRDSVAPNNDDEETVEFPVMFQKSGNAFIVFGTSFEGIEERVMVRKKVNTGSK